MWRAAKAAEFVPKFWPRSWAATDGSNVTPFRAEIDHLLGNAVANRDFLE